MGYIYKITNKLSGKSYIGQTKSTIEERMRKHIDRAKNGIHPTGVDGAIKKYGIENFELTIICKCPNEDLNDLESFYIDKFDTFKDFGYNLTSGGQGAPVLDLDEQEVINKYKELKTMTATAKYFNCSDKTISRILKANEIEINRDYYSKNGLASYSLENLKKGKKFQVGDKAKPIKLIELNLEFPSLKDCCQWLIDNKYSKASSVDLARKSLSRALNGDRDTYCGFHFEFIDTSIEN